MSRLEIAKLNPETRRFSRAEIVEPGDSRTLINHGSDGKKEVILLERTGDISIISRAEIDKTSSVEPGRLYLIDGVQEPLKDVARLEQGHSLDLTIKEAEFGTPTQYRFTHK